MNTEQLTRPTLSTNLPIDRTKTGPAGLCRRWRRGLLLTLLIGPIASAAEPQPPISIERLMAPQEFQEAGLHQLSEAELAALNQWLVRYTEGDAAIAERIGAEARAATESRELVTRITGEFSGWSGKTLFRLANGQVWRQRLRGRHRYSGPPNPEVKIDRNALGFFRLTLVESGQSIGIKRVR